MKTIVTTYPFGNPNPAPIKLLNTHNIEFSLNPAERKYNREEHHKILRDSNPEAIIAGTEKYDADALDLCPNLKIISRVGIGLDSINLDECEKRGIVVTNGPETCTNAVAEITICQMLNVLRQVPKISNELKQGIWNRYIGKEIRDCNIGIIGVGRIGTLVLEKLQSLKPRRIFLYDKDVKKTMHKERAEATSLMNLLSNSDVVTIHIPLDDNYHFIDKIALQMMKANSCIINYSRGGIINEQDLLEHIHTNGDFRAVIDTFEEEPYKGPFTREEQIILTPHLGSCTTTARIRMEMQATEDVINFMNGRPVGNRIV
jgi:D-3-phosphoglycerate dehydrogenase